MIGRGKTAAFGLDGRAETPAKKGVGARLKPGDSRPSSFLSRAVDSHASGEPVVAFLSMRLMLLADAAVDPVAQAWIEFLGRLHPVALHFPLALLLVGAVAVVWNWFRGEEGIGEFAFHCIWIGAAMSLVAAVTGWFLGEEEAGEKGLELHRWFGVGSAAAAVALTAMASLSRTDARPGLLGMTRILALVTALGTAYAGHLGGEMVWGESEVSGKFAKAVGATWDRYREELGKPSAAPQPAESAAIESPKAESAPKAHAVAPPPALPAPSTAAKSTSPGAVRGSDGEEPPAGAGASSSGAPPAKEGAGESKPAEKSGVPAPIPPKKPVSFKTDLLPLLKDRCFECHSGEKPKDGVAFDHIDELIKTEGKRAVVMKGDPTRSTMFTTIMRGDESKKRMPPPKSGKRLTPEQAGIIQAWIKEGAKLDT
jgi:uncharacterized membrane protein